MKKIVIDGRMLNWTGVGLYTRRLLEQLQKLDHQNEYQVLLLKQDFDSWQPTAKNFHKVLVNFQPYSFGEQIGLALLLYRLRPKFVHFLAVNHPVLYFGNKIMTIHDLTLVYYRNVRNSRRRYWLKYWAYRLVLRHGVKTAKYLLTPSKFVAEQLRQRFHLKSEKVQPIWLGVDKPQATEAPRRKPSKEFLLYVGNAYPYKNLELLIQAFAHLDEPNLQLVLVGKIDFFYKQLQQLVKTRAITNVFFAGFLPDAKRNWLYQHTKLFVLPSLSEGFGLIGLEAMQYGAPVLAAEASCLPEIYSQGAQFFNPHDPEDLANQIKRLLRNQKLRRELEKAGRERVSKFSWELAAQQTLKVYEKA